MTKQIELLLLDTVENLGLVGDVVKVKPGYARNYLLPHGFAEPPTPSKVDSLKEARARAQAELAALRTEREKLVEQMAEVSVEIERNCNDQGALYGSVTHRDISDALMAAGWGVDVRSVRIAHPIRHIGIYPVPLEFDKDLGVEVTVTVRSDRDLEGYTRTGEAVEHEEGEGEEAHRDHRRPRQRRDEFSAFSDLEEEDRREKRERRERRDGRGGRGGRKDR